MGCSGSVPRMGADPPAQLEGKSRQKNAARERPDPALFRAVDLEKEVVIRRPGEINGWSFDIRGLRKCTVVLMDHSEQVVIEGCSDCRIAVFACESSVFVRDCKRCEFILCARQVRVRDGVSCGLHLHTETRPVIESSRRLRLGPCRATYFGHASALGKARLDLWSNRWWQVHDFTADGGVHWTAIGREEGDVFFDGEYASELDTDLSEELHLGSVMAVGDWNIDEAELPFVVPCGVDMAGSPKLAGVVLVLDTNVWEVNALGGGFRKPWRSVGDAARALVTAIVASDDEEEDEKDDEDEEDDEKDDELDEGSGRRGRVDKEEQKILATKRTQAKLNLEESAEEPVTMPKLQTDAPSSGGAADARPLQSQRSKSAASTWAREQVAQTTSLFLDESRLVQLAHLSHEDPAVIALPPCCSVSSAPPLPTTPAGKALVSVRRATVAAAEDRGHPRQPSPERPHWNNRPAVPAIAIVFSGPVDLQLRVKEAPILPNTRLWVVTKQSDIQTLRQLAFLDWDREENR